MPRNRIVSSALLSASVYVLDLSLDDSSKAIGLGVCLAGLATLMLVRTMVVSEQLISDLLALGSISVDIVLVHEKQKAGGVVVGVHIAGTCYRLTLAAWHLLRGADPGANLAQDLNDATILKVDSTER